VFWTITVIISLKYVLLMLRADNHGERGLIAMLALATVAVRDRPRLRRALMTAGLFGTAGFYGDGVITPVISVLSAVGPLQSAEIALLRDSAWVNSRARDRPDAPAPCRRARRAGSPPPPVPRCVDR